MKIMSLDISGNWKEGKGTTGVAIGRFGESEHGDIFESIQLSELKAEDFESAVEYWASHEDLIQSEFPDYLIIEGYKLYNHKGKSASMQANSELETPQLKGALKLVAYRMNIPTTIQFASEVKNRWSEEVLVRVGILEEKGGRFYFRGQPTNPHKRDALKHLLHFRRYKL